MKTTSTKYISMRYLCICTLVILFSGTNAFSQQPSGAAKPGNKIVGLWQTRSALVASGLLTNWRFYGDGKFSYNIVSDLNPLHSISGSYSLGGDSILYLKVKQITQLKGYKIVPMDPSHDFGTFELEGGIETTIEQNDKEYKAHTLKIFNDAGRRVIQMDGATLFFRVSTDPDAERN
jgi:hypothetical protein